jgi:hypothetical protein
MNSLILSLFGTFILNVFYIFFYRKGYYKMCTYSAKEELN